MLYIELSKELERGGGNAYMLYFVALLWLLQMNREMIWLEKTAQLHYLFSLLLLFWM